MNFLSTLLGMALLAAGIGGWVVNTRVNGNPFAGIKERQGAELGLGGDEAYAGVVEADEDSAFSFEGKVDYRPGAKRRLIAIGWLILVVAVVGAAVAGLVGLIVWIVNSAIIGYMTGG